MRKQLYLMIFVLILSFANTVKADEGMWIPMLIGKNYEQMKKQGFKLTAQDLYNANGSSLKDAIVHFGGFCTGEIVSDKGLIFTNHHCGYDAIASNSTPQNNILDNGFYAKSYAEEKPIGGLFVRFLQRMEDVTAQVNTATKGLTGAEKSSKMLEIFNTLSKAAVKAPNIEANVKDFYKSNQFILFVYERFDDVRLVGAPPQNIGKFGGDTDNWEWPRQTGDFSVFRVYASKGNQSAKYAVDNMPYKPKKFLPVSLKGVKNGDFSMVYGYPGRTDRYLTSYGVDLATDKVSPTIVKLRDIRLKAWKTEMDKSVDTRLKLSSQYANIANYWKYYIGQTEQLKRLKVADSKRTEERAFTEWAAQKSEFAGLMEQYADIYKSIDPISVQRTYINEGFLASGWVPNAISLGRAYSAVAQKKGDEAFAAQVKTSVNEAAATYEETYVEAADKKIFAQILASFYKDIPVKSQPMFFAAIAEKYWTGNPETTFQKYADYLWENSNLIKPEKLKAFLASKATLEDLKKDPGYQYAVNLLPADYIKTNFGSLVADFENKKAELDHLYLKATLERNPGKLMYPDANSTMRLSYGNVQDYSPKDGITYNITTTIDGAMQKYIPGDGEFDLPANLIENYNKRNFGQYGNDGTLTVGFISNNDITGGNSGSPVINGNGELIGLAFDGNWEAMSGDIAFDKKFKRTISVDIRYVLWCIDVLGGAKNIIDELDLRKNTPAAKTAVKKK
ncbi:S46 family peptidase [Pedobacter metabolipauper]|uniref:Dipeptidyl-peptidase n=1 Tax=Pedobacter metabolipauper TaxID=425513 RepID=A0A4R6SUQ6_9SPHI|nr:S46 family peptidase [Pedobacter metabolipauper]TDQ08151.1 peptidase S46-like protein [Pedobacter metabolipauper]